MEQKKVRFAVVGVRSIGNAYVTRAIMKIPEAELVTICDNNEEIEKFSTSSLLTRTVRDVSVLQMIVVFGLQMFLKAPLIFFLAVGKISEMSGDWTRIIIYIVIGLVAILAVLIAYCILVMTTISKFNLVFNYFFINRRGGEDRRNAYGRYSNRTYSQASQAFSCPDMQAPNEPSLHSL